MKRMIIGMLAGLGTGYLMWTARGRELVERAKQRTHDPVVDVAVVGTIPSEPAGAAGPTDGVENLRATV